MRVKAPLPENTTLEGDEEEETIVSPTPDAHPTSPHDKVDNISAGKRMQEFLKRGLITRAIVSYNPAGDVPVDALYDPSNWGIVIEISAFDKWPCKVKWIDGKTSWTDGTDLTVIHRGLTDKEVKELNETHFVH